MYKVIVLLLLAACSASSDAQDHSFGPSGDMGVVDGYWCRHDDVSPGMTPICNKSQPDAWRQCKDGLVIVGPGCPGLAFVVEGNVFVCCKYGKSPALQ